MESLRDIKQQIKAINSTKQMMLTMKMVSSARIRSAQNTMLNGRPFAQKMAALIDNLRKDIQNPESPFRKNEYYKYFDAETGDENIRAVSLKEQDGAKNGFGANYHPNETSQRELAETVLKELKE